MPSKRVGIDRGRLPIKVDGVSVALPVGSRPPLERIPHLARAYLDPVERAGFELLMGIGLGCSGVIVRDALETEVDGRPLSEPSGSVVSVKIATPEADSLRDTLAAIAALVNNDVPGSRLAKYPQYKVPAYIEPGKELACFIRGLESALLPVKASLADWGSGARPGRYDGDQCWTAWYQGLNAASRLNVSAPGKAWAYIAALKRVNEASGIH
jgi:hypothetical protein